MYLFNLLRVTLKNSYFVINNLCFYLITDNFVKHLKKFFVCILIKYTGAKVYSQIMKYCT